ncbi:MAG: nickel-dependent hydrogenase large subunit [Actinomycetota bacterium]
MIGETTLLDFLLAGKLVAHHRPWPRYQLDARSWRALVECLSAAEWTVMAEWAEPGEIHLALRDERTGDVAVASHPCPDHKFFAVGQIRPGTVRIERAIRDIWGLEPEGLEDQRPWLDHGRWPARHPLAAHRAPPAPHPHRYTFNAAEGEGLHQIPVGPVHAGVIEPGHFRFHCQGETVVRLEERLGYVHKGIEAACANRGILEAGRIVARVSGDSTVAYSLAYARAVEAALGIEPPPRAHWLRALMAECERIANHVFDIGAICNDAAFAIMLSHMGWLREKVLRSNDILFGHRLLMDRIVPGGVTRDIGDDGIEALKHMLYGLRKMFDKAVHLYRDTPSLIDRTVGTGVVAGSLAHRFGAGGFVGRASGRPRDARRTPGYPPYDDLDLAVPIQPEGDVNARVEVRIAEVRESLRLLSRILNELPEGAITAPVPTRGGEGMGVAESFRGEVVVWVRISEAGRIVRCHPHDPSWFQWPLLEAAIEGNIVADFPLCNKSFNCSYSGHDL